MATIPSALGAGLLSRFLTRITTHKLALIVGVLFLFDFITPDPIPFIDEIVLGLLTLLLARWQGRHSEPEPAPSVGRQPLKDVTPR
jgi:hypothetical protein